MRCFLPFADSNRGKKTRVTGFPVFMEIESREWTAQDLTSQLVMQRPWLADWKYRYNRCTNRGSPVSCFHRCLSHYFKKKNTRRRRKQGKSTILRKGSSQKTAKETEGGKADFSGSRVRSEIKGGPNVFSRPTVRSLSVHVWPVKTAFNSSQFTRDFRERKNEIQRTSGVRPAPGIGRNSEWLFAVP